MIEEADSYLLIGTALAALGGVIYPRFFMGFVFIMCTAHLATRWVE